MILIKKILTESFGKYGKALYFMPYQSSTSFNNLIDSEITNNIEDDDYIMIINKISNDSLIFCFTSRKLNYLEGQDVSLVHENTKNIQPGKILLIFSLKDYESTETRLYISHELQEFGISLDKEYPLKKIV